MKVIKDNSYYPDSETHILIVAKFDYNIKINFFQARKKDDQIIRNDLYFINDDAPPIEYCLLQDILKKKLDIVLEKGNGGAKQVDDLLYILEKYKEKYYTTSDLPF